MRDWLITYACSKGAVALIRLVQMVISLRRASKTKDVILSTVRSNFNNSRFLHDRLMHQQFDRIHISHVVHNKNQ
jgi:hypothetical protein